MAKMIFEDDTANIPVKESVGVADSVQVFKHEPRQSASKAVRISLADSIENLAAYNVPQFRPFPLQEGENGECVFCGDKTSSTHRKVCGACMEKEHQKLYEKIQNAIQNQDNFIDL